MNPASTLHLNFHQPQTQRQPYFLRSIAFNVYSSSIEAFVVFNKMFEEDNKKGTIFSSSVESFLLLSNVHTFVWLFFSLLKVF